MQPPTPLEVNGLRLVSFDEARLPDLGTWDVVGVLASPSWTALMLRCGCHMVIRTKFPVPVPGIHLTLRDIRARLKEHADECVLYGVMAALRLAEGPRAALEQR